MRTTRLMTMALIALGLQTTALAQFSGGEGTAGDGIRGGAQVVEGRILDTFSVRSEAGQEIMARLLTRDDNVTFVNLGPAEMVQGINVRPGTYVMLRGEWDYRGSMPVVRARQIAPVFTLDRAAQAAQQDLQSEQAAFDTPGALQRQFHDSAAEDRQAAPAERAVIGKIDSVRFTQLQGQDRRHMLARVRSAEGGTVVVNLGDPGSWPRGTDVQPGQWLAVVGQTGTINDRVVLFAEQFGKLQNVIRAESGSATEAAN